MPTLGIATPVGPLALVASDTTLVSIGWGLVEDGAETPLLTEAARQIGAYFAGTLREFDLPLAFAGTPFQQAVAEAMIRIPFGAVRSYGEIARELGGAARAIGAACGANRLPIVVPCHRVLAAGGRLGGYSGGGGTETKRRLLVLEGALIA